MPNKKIKDTPSIEDLLLTEQNTELRKYLSRKSEDEIYELLENILSGEKPSIYEPTIKTLLLFLKDKKVINISLLERAICIIEENNHENAITDDFLVKIYEEDKLFVTKCLQKRLYASNRPDIAGEHLKWKIQNSEHSAVVKMLEKEIDDKNTKMLLFGDFVLLSFLPSETDLLDWCKKWKDDERKKRVILLSLQRILTDMLEEEIPQSEEATDLVKELSEKEHLDYRKLTKEISISGNKQREDILKALKILKHLLTPKIQINPVTLQENLKKYPYVNEAIGEHLIRNAEAEPHHILSIIYSEEIDSKMKSMMSSLETTEEIEDAWKWMQYNRLVHILKEREYWEETFKILAEHSLLAPTAKKLKDPSNANNILVEAEVIARMALRFKVELEPNLPEFVPSKIDLRIEYEGEKAIIEVMSIKESIKSYLVRGAISSVPGMKTKNALLSKFKKQLKEGKTNPKTPIIFVAHIAPFLSEYDIENAIYGELKYSIKTKPGTGEVLEEGFFRDKNSFYAEEDTDIITAIFTYQREIGNMELDLKTYLPPRFRVPRNPISKEFMEMLTLALSARLEPSTHSDR